MEKLHRTYEITDIKLAHVYNLIKKYSVDGITLSVIEETLAAEMSPSSISIGLRELRDMGCISSKRITVSPKRYLAHFSITAHNCGYCTPNIKYERPYLGSIFIPPVGDF